jgi:hypothetical protein
MGVKDMLLKKPAVTRPQVHLMRDDMGTGKTQAFLEYSGMCQAKRLEADKGGQIVGATPRHDLNNQIGERWQQLDGVTLTAATIEGRLAKDTRRVDPDKADPNWCRNTELVATSQEHGFPTKETCCIRRDRETGVIETCIDFARCGYQAQFAKAREADLVMIPHALLAHQIDEIGEPYLTFIDEDFIENLIFKMPREGSRFRFEVEDLLIDNNAARGLDPWLDFRERREELYDWMQKQIKAGELGGLQKKYNIEKFEFGKIIGDGKWVPCQVLTPETCGSAIHAEFQACPRTDELRPNLKGARLERCIKQNAAKFKQRARHMFMVRAWEIIQDLLLRDDDEPSGRIFLYEDEDTGRICIGLRGLSTIAKQWLAPMMFVASGTMPPVDIIRHAFPDCDIIEDKVDPIEMPKHVSIIQITDAPIAKHKTRKENIKSALRRCALEQALVNDACCTKTNEPAMLLGVQKELREAFVEMKPAFPNGIEVRNFNGVAGLNGFENVKVMTSMGRAAAKPRDIEDQMAAITGKETRHRMGYDERGNERWFAKAEGFIELRDGSKIKVDIFMHPDPEIEAWRRYKHIAHIMQMIARSRYVNRTEENPLIIYVLCNEPLGIKVDEVLNWKKDQLEPLALIEPMACDGFVVLAPEAMTTLWPTVFKSKRTAERELQQLRNPSDKRGQRINKILSGWKRFTVQKQGERQKPREGCYDPARFEGVEGLREALKPFGSGLAVEGVRTDGIPSLVRELAVCAH